MTPAGRLPALDLIRGVAVLGILAVNIAGFAGPPAAVLSPNLPEPATLADRIVYAATFIVFEGKMRALFAILFGAGMAAFITRERAAGRDGEGLQLRRLGWLLLFGLLHYFLLWWGDILLTYALLGIAALLISELDTRRLTLAALVLFIGWHAGGAAGTLPGVLAEHRVLAGTASAREVAEHATLLRDSARYSAMEISAARDGFAATLALRLADPLHRFLAAFRTSGEVLPMMMIGIALFRTGFFSGGWGIRRTAAVAAACGVAGLAMTLAMLGLVWRLDFPLATMTAALLYWTALPHLLLAIAYAGSLVLLAPRLLSTAPGRRLVAAGRMAFSNYIGTTIMMAALFHGWGLGLAGRFGETELLAFVALGWLAMLGWSAPWLARFRQGPLEALWRWLTERGWQITRTGEARN